MKRKSNAVVIMAGICAIALLVMLIALVFAPNTIIQTFTPPPFEKAAEFGLPNVSKIQSWSELDADAFKVGVCGEITVHDKSADVWLTNPESNSIWLKLRVMDTNGNILGETGLITPGQYIKSVALNAALQSGTPIVLKVMAYEPETYHSAGSISINTII